jgi:hypothetical protein
MQRVRGNHFYCEFSRGVRTEVSWNSQRHYDLGEGPLRLVFEVFVHDSCLDGW